MMQGPRTPLVLSSSSDQGKTWQVIMTLEDKPPPSKPDQMLGIDFVSSHRESSVILVANSAALSNRAL
jgi:hypothetical protein